MTEKPKKTRQEEQDGDDHEVVSNFVHLCAEQDVRHHHLWVRTEKGFKEAHLNIIAKLVFEFSAQEVTSTQVYNHLRNWRVRWIHVSILRDISGAQWNEETRSILLETEHL